MRKNVQPHYYDAIAHYTSSCVSERKCVRIQILIFIIVQKSRHDSQLGKA